MKMLWYVDSFSYKMSGHAMTGMVYRHNTMGALPVGHYSLMNLENLNVHEEESYNFDSMLHIYPIKGICRQLFLQIHHSHISFISSFS